MIRLITALLFTVSLTLVACNNNPKPETVSTQSSEILPGSFLDFLDEFHSDITFQKAHIQWPLEGLPTMMDGRDSTLVVGAHRWTENEWVMHHDFDENNEEFEQVYSMVGDYIVIEKTLHINGSMGMERRFTKQDDTWKLIYYAGMNLIKK